MLVCVDSAADHCCPNIFQPIILASSNISGTILLSTRSILNPDSLVAAIVEISCQKCQLILSVTILKCLVLTAHEVFI